MKRIIKPQRLRDMSQEAALAHCAGITSTEWSVLGTDPALALWRLFKGYIASGYKNPGAPIPADIAEVWDRCKAIIDEEAAK